MTTAAMIEAHARAYAKFNGQDFDDISEIDQARYRKRSMVFLQAAFRSVDTSQISSELRKRADQISNMLLSTGRLHPDAELMRRAADAIDVSAPDSTATTEQAVGIIWRAAITAACNIVTQRQNNLAQRNCSPAVLSEQRACLSEMKRWIDLEANPSLLDEVRSLLFTAPPGTEEPNP